MKKSSNSYRKLEEFKLMIIFSVLTLALLAIYPGNIYFPEISESLQKFGGYINNKYVLEGTGAVILVLFAYHYIHKIIPLTVNFDNTSVKYEYVKDKEPANYLAPRGKKISENASLQKTFGKVDDGDEDKEKTNIERIRLFTAIPVLFIAIAEILIFLNRIDIAVWVHIGILTALALSNIFIRDPKINKIHRALMLLPVLRLVNLSMPVFFETTLYTFIFIYAPLAIPVAVLIMHQRSSLEEIGISLKHIVGYVILSIPLGFLLGLGEYLTIQNGYLIPDMSFENLLKLTIIMIFFVGLIEELIFRSILQTRLEQALSSGDALLITSVLFGLMHSGYGTFYEILYTGFVGLFIGFSFYKTRSLPFVTVLHGCVNIFLFGIFPHLYSSGIRV